MYDLQYHTLVVLSYKMLFLTSKVWSLQNISKYKPNASINKIYCRDVHLTLDESDIIMWKWQHEHPSPWSFHFLFSFLFLFLFLFLLSYDFFLHKILRFRSLSETSYVKKLLIMLFANFIIQNCARKFMLRNCYNNLFPNRYKQTL